MSARPDPAAGEAAARAAAARFAPAGIVALDRQTGGHIHGSWRLARADGPRLLLQRLNAHVFPDPPAVMANVAAVTAFLARAEPDPRRRLALVPTADGAPWYAAPDGALWRAFVFIEDAAPPPAPPTEAQAYRAARAFGRFVAALAGYDGPPLAATIPGFHDTPARLGALGRAVRADRVGRVAGARAELAAVAARRGLAHGLDGRGLPVRIAHHDAKLANVLFDDATGDALCVVDLDTTMPGLALYDFGDLARSATADAAEDALAAVAFRPDRYAALEAGFLDGAGGVLTRPERAALPTAARVITFEQAVRFLTDHLDGDRYYPAAHAGHNLDRARAALALLDGMEAAWGVGVRGGAGARR